MTTRRHCQTMQTLHQRQRLRFATKHASFLFALQEWSKSWTTTIRRLICFKRKRESYHGTSSAKLRFLWAALLSIFSRRVMFAVAKESISVATPPTVETGEAFSVEWEFATDSYESGTTGDLHPFQIELRRCGANSNDCESPACGSSYISLCKREGGCMDSDGSYNVVIPTDVTVGDYVIKVTYMGPSGWDSGSSSAPSEEVGACSETFSVEQSQSIAAQGMPSLEAITPQSELQAGEPFTARWQYDDGEGNGDGAFEVNLYECRNGACAEGRCGELVGALCGTGGCYDPGMGDYDVRLPATISPGKFKLQVKKTAEDNEEGDDDGETISSCTESWFDVVSSSNNSTIASAAPTPAAVSGGGGDSSNEGETAPPTAVSAPPTAVTTSPTAVTSSPTAVTSSPTAVTSSPTAVTPAPLAETAPPTIETEAPTTVTGFPTPVPTGALPTATSASSSSSTGSGIAGVPPTPIPARVECSSAAVLTYSYKVESSGMPLVTIVHESGDRDEGGCATLTTLWEWLSTKPSDVPSDLLYPAHPDSGVADVSDSAQATGVWLLRTSVDVFNGVMFEVKGTGVEGGDCDQLLLSSSSDLFVRLRGYGGHLYIKETHITSWVEEAQREHDFDADADGSSPRSYVSCVSEILEPDQTCDGVAQKERGVCRMDILDSEMSFLGFEETESYGISWKVRGLCEDLSNVDTLFDRIRVYGDLMRSDIHHMWYGMYSYGHLGGVWTDNLMHDNHVYGFDPHDDSDYLTIQGNSCFNNGNHGIIASKRCDHLLLKDNESFDNLGSGLMLHRSCDDSVVEGNKLYDNFDGGLSLVETSRTYVTGNEFNGNKWGIRSLAGANDNTIEENSFANNTLNDIMQYLGSEADTPEVWPFTGINERNTYNLNTVHSTTKDPVVLKNSLDTVISNNEFTGPGTLSFIGTNGTRLSGNTGPPAEASPKVENSCFTPASGVVPAC